MLGIEFDDPVEVGDGFSKIRPLGVGFAAIEIGLRQFLAA